ncbi:BA75_03343T0 [Komagataella pastoris]|uniref:BA75_03343T0 n=1 Tax=Komagataella pastoris TaxID=4922 RepID=A0A1B2JFP1_PICPA|nr:BA75_03343T0 [Komagataella pastoris]
MLKGVNLALKRFASRPSLEQGVSIPNRPLKKIQIGKARPAIYYKFDCQVELSDGSVITRKSQYPKVEMRMITDQRNSPFWNCSRKDLVSGDTGARGRLNKFKQRYSVFADNSQEEDTVEDTRSDNEFLDLIGSNHVEQKLGGNIASRKRNSKK